MSRSCDNPNCEVPVLEPESDNVDECYCSEHCAIEAREGGSE